ncbi:NAD(P)/FAD-dependent oxidoreductase [Agaribacterium sp. ZY112]|uniref:NAD(P)/FAD-dependent oxidoreductase n=1 Tax=Agaribacterium sp. ZY112 TaxID=3233574 RepID=UPI003525BE67
MNNSKVSPIRKKNIAVVGSGVSGLSCAWLLSQVHDVTLYEKDDRLGGHSNTVSFNLPTDSKSRAHTANDSAEKVDVDTGFIVYNPINYPNLVQLFKYFNVENCKTEMSFGISINEGQLEYSGTGLRGLFSQKSNLLKPKFWGMIRELTRFYRDAEALEQKYELDNISLGDLLERENYGKSFIYDHLLPMGAAIWSTPVDKMLNYPASSFMRFCRNHGLVQLKDRPQWRTVVGGSINYVNKLAEHFQGELKLNSRIHRIIRRDGFVYIEDHHGKQDCYDEVVLACHSDQALALLDQASDEEQRLLSCFPYQRNKAYLHTDDSLMPKRKQAWSAWNYLSAGKRDQSQQVCVTYWMNRLQPLSTETDLFVSLNPIKEPKPDKIIRSFFYDHPEFGKNALSAQKELWSLQGKQQTWFCGAYFGYGFHEDGLQAGLAVAEQLGGIERPWQLDEPSNRIHVSPRHATSIINNTANNSAKTNNNLASGS